MGATVISPTYLSAYLLLLCLVCSLKEGYAMGRRATVAESHHLEHSHTIQASSLLPSSICSPATKVMSAVCCFASCRPAVSLSFLFPGPIRIR
ncbi:hypothetical protein Gohar_022877, partial [Gossypium harknessii]|nr:hypothetical protein [Gossypium harknessii]